MSNGPFSPSTVFEPLHPDAHVYGSLTDLLSDGYEPTQVVIVHPGSEPPVTLRRTIADLQHRYDQWAAKQQKRAHPAPDHEVTGVDYVPDCDQCHQSVFLDDDDKWQHYS